MLRVLPEFNVWAVYLFRVGNLLLLRERTGNSRFVQHPSKDRRESPYKILECG